MLKRLYNFQLITSNSYFITQQDAATCRRFPTRNHVSDQPL
jgi:hypothetical protein